ncbi:MerR family transcriptional regulator [Pullulanibacillus camelliae]|uniref:MerR family transcriptional regulator n=1 Tax=Pullulanibacillus camelliae TaxID=1707096 RepID=A0A8J2YNK7_9BACL|nr:MerR family transcriptional regulator [Pullulanibacillus camelliae]GGE55856.1 MerR family transcriptional regulator [Pullulanibacillus camelliae]
MKKISETFNTIKQAAEFSGLSEDTIRYYEKIGLLPYADRKANGHRTYSQYQLEAMIFLTRLKATGMTLEEMKHYRKLSEEGPTAIPKKIALLKKQKERIQNEVSRLLDTQRIIDYKIDHYNDILFNPDIDDSNCDPIE